MKKFRKVIAMGLATMAAVSAMSVSAFAADNSTVKDNIDWSQVDTSMMVPGQEWHKYEELYLNPPVSKSRATMRTVFSGAVNDIPKNQYPITTSNKKLCDNINFEDDEIGHIEVTFTRMPNYCSSVNVSCFDLNAYEVVDWDTIDEDPNNVTSNQKVDFYVSDTSHTYILYVSQNDYDGETDNARAIVKVE